MDKFQGREAPVAIYSMTTSSPEDAPRDLEFLYSGNRFNVAISRARGLAVLVASPELLRVACKTPEQMRLVNMLCSVCRTRSCGQHAVPGQSERNVRAILNSSSKGKVLPERFRPRSGSLAKPS